MNSTDLESWCDFTAGVAQTLRAPVSAESFGSLTMKASNEGIPKNVLSLMTMVVSVPWSLYNIAVHSRSL